MYICINTAIGDPPCVCVCVSDQARREEPHQIDSQKEWAASRLSQGLRGLKTPSGRRVGLNTHPDRARAPRRGKALTPLSS